MTTSPSLRISVYAADEEGGSGSDSSNDGGSDSGSSDSGSDNGGGESKDSGSKDQGSDSNDNSGDQGQEQKEEVSSDNPNSDQPDYNVAATERAAAEKEQAAIDDYVYEEPGIVKPYPEKEIGVGKTIKSSDEINVSPGSDKPVTKEPVNKEPIKHVEDCKNKGWTHECQQDHPGKGKGDGCNEKWKQDWHHNGKCDGGHGGHGHDGNGHHNDWCDHHDCHHHDHHTSTHFSDSHHGDVTVRVNVDYGTSSKHLEDVHLIIGDVYEKNLDLSDKPDQIKVDNLDIDGGDDFAVCLANEDSDEGDCVVTHASSDHDEVKVSLKVF